MSGIAAVLLWPLLRHASTGLPHWYFDNWMDCWTLWWMRQALWAHPQNPFVTSLLEHPIGAEMYWHNLEPSKSVLGVVLVPLMGAVAARNLLVWTTFPLAGYTAWLLVRYLLERQGTPRPIAGPAAFAGACVFAFSRYHLCHAEAHLNLSAIEGIPLYLLFFFRYLDHGRRKDLAAVTLAAVYTTFCDSYYLVYSAVISLFWVVALAWRGGGLVRLATLSLPVVRRAALVLGAVLLALSPWAVALVVHAFPAPISPFHGDSDFAADLSGYLIPDRISAWLPRFPAPMRDLVSHLQGDNEECGYFLGYVTPALGIVAARPAFVRDGGRWLALGVTFVVLSLGVDLSVGGSRDVQPWVILAMVTFVAVATPNSWRSRARRDVWLALGALTVACYLVPVTANGAPFHAHLSLPYALFKTVVPFFGRAGMPDRFVLVSTLALAVLFGGFAARVSARFSRRWVAVGVALVLAAVPCVEYRGRPITMGPVPTLPPVFDEIRREPPEVAVFTDASPMSQFEQITHGHAISYGRFARVPIQLEAFERSERVYQVLHHLRTLADPVSQAERVHMRAFLKEHRFRYYVAHYWDVSRDRFVREELGGRLIYRAPDGGVIVYRFDDVT
jgi:hypothetical protein